MKILLVRQDKLGDCLLTTPIPEAIHRKFPDAEIHVACQDSQVEIFRRLKDVKSVQIVPLRPGFLRIGEFAKRWKEENFDAVVLLKMNSGDYSISAWKAGIPIRVGWTDKGHGKFLTKNLYGRIKPNDPVHEVKMDSILVGEALGTELSPGPLVFEPTPEEFRKAGEVTSGLDEYGVVAPFTGGSGRAWPLDHWQKFVSSVSSQTQMPWVILGAPSDTASSHVLTGEGIKDLTGKLTLHESAAVVKKSRMVVCANTGLLHIAASQGTPIVEIDARPDWRLIHDRWLPWQSRFVSVKPESDEFCSVSDAMEKTVEFLTELRAEAGSTQRL